MGEPGPLKVNRTIFKLSGGAPLTVSLQAVERTVKVAVEADLRVAEEAAREEPRSGVKADLVAVLQQASTRELHRKSAVFPVEADEDPSRWILDNESIGEVEPSCLNEPGEKRDVFVSVLDHFVIR